MIAVPFDLSHLDAAREKASELLACACGGKRSMIIALYDTDETPPRRGASVRCGRCGRVSIRLAPRMLAALASIDGRVVQPRCGATARALRERGLLGDSVIATDLGVAIAEMLKAELWAQRASEGDSDHVW